MKTENSQVNLVFAELPPEMVFHVFNYLLPKDLFNAALVCKQWFELFKHPEIWRSIVLKYGWTQKNNETVLEVARRQVPLFIKGDILKCTPAVECWKIEEMSNWFVSLHSQMVGGTTTKKYELAIWDLETKKKLHVFTHERGLDPINLCDFYLTSARLVEKDQPTSLTLFHTNGNRVEVPIAAPAVAVASHSKFLAIAVERPGYESKIFIYDPSNGQEIETITDEKFNSDIYVNLEFYKDYLLSRERNGKVRIWDYSTGKGQLISEFFIHIGRQSGRKYENASSILAFNDKILVEQKEENIFVHELEKGGVVYQFSIEKNKWELWGISAAINGNTVAITSNHGWRSHRTELYLANINEKTVEKYLIDFPDNVATRNRGSCWIDSSLYVLVNNEIVKVHFTK